MTKKISDKKLLNFIDENKLDIGYSFGWGEFRIIKTVSKFTRKKIKSQATVLSQSQSLRTAIMQAMEVLPKIDLERIRKRL